MLPVGWMPEKILVLSPVPVAASLTMRPMIAPWTTRSGSRQSRQSPPDARLQATFANVSTIESSGPDRMKKITRMNRTRY